MDKLTYDWNLSAVQQNYYADLTKPDNDDTEMFKFFEAGSELEGGFKNSKNLRW